MLVENPQPDESNVEQPVLPIRIQQQRPMDTLNINETVYWRSHEEQPVSYPTRSKRELSVSGEQVWGPRKNKVGETFAPIDVGYLTDPGVSLILIHNTHGIFKHYNPSQEQKTLEKTKILELGVDEGDGVVRSIGLLILASETQRITPKDGCKHYIRSLNGVTNFVVTAFPR